MSSTNLDIRQSQTRVLQDQLNSAATTQMDSTLASINNELTYPGRLIAQSTPSLVVTVGNGTVVNPNTSKNRILPLISNTAVTFTGGTITFPSTSGTITVSPGTNATFTIGASQYLPILVQLSNLGQLGLTVGTAVSSLGSVVFPTGGSNALSLGYIVIQSNASSVVQSITNSMLYQFTGSAVGAAVGGRAYPTYFLSPAGSGDGTTFAAALAALPSVGGVILLMDAITITSTVTIPNNVKVMGRDKNAIITIGSGGQMVLSGTSTVLEDLSFSSALTGSSAYVLVSGNNAIIRNCEFSAPSATASNTYIEVAANDTFLENLILHQTGNPDTNVGVQFDSGYAGGILLNVKGTV